MTLPQRHVEAEAGFDSLTRASPFAVVGPSERDAPLEVWGPAGTRALMRGLLNAFSADIHVRRDVDEKASRRGVEVDAHDVRDGFVYQRGGVTVRAFLVDRGPVKPAFGYRVGYAGHSVAISGDTRPSDALVSAAKNVDVLLHDRNF